MKRNNKTGKDSYRQAIQRAYNNGYRAGWTAHEELPKRFGARTVAKHGYSNGLRDHKRDDKYRTRVKKIIESTYVIKLKNSAKCGI